VTRDRIWELAGVPGPRPAPMKALPSATRARCPVAIRALPTAQRSTSTWEARIGLKRATRPADIIVLNAAAVNRIVGCNPIHSGFRPISGSACLASTGGAKTAQEIIAWIRVKRMVGPM